MTVAAGPSEPTALAAEPPVRYVGLATRVVSFVIDAAVIDFAVIVGGIGASLILALLHLPSEIKTILAVIGGVVVILWRSGTSCCSGRRPDRRRAPGSCRFGW
jgi:hypothetical protein